MSTRYEKNAVRIKAFMNTDEGKEALKAVFDICGYFNPTETLEAMSLAYQTGRRDVAVDIVKFLEMQDQDIVRLVRDAERSRTQGAIQ